MKDNNDKGQEVQSRSERISEFNTIKKEYRELREKFLNPKPGMAEIPKIDLRTRAQRLISLALKLKEDFRQSAENGHPEHKDYVEKFEEEVRLRELDLKEYGSAMRDIPKTTFEDVAGLEDVKSTINDYLFALLNPQIADRYNIDTNIGLLMYGPPGTGKSMVAEAIANRLGVRFFTISPSQIFGSYVGESERNVRDLFEELRACDNGAVVLIDECEAIFSKRSANSDRSAIGVANQLLQEMNGVKDSGVKRRRVMVGATNRPEMMDPAYLRYKRFSRHFYIGMPVNDAKTTVIQKKMHKLPHEKRVIDEMLSVFNADEKTYTVADISNIIEQCAYLAMSEYRRLKESNPDATEVPITIHHFRTVMSTFAPSVTPEMLEEYFAFRDRMKNDRG